MKKYQHLIHNAAQAILPKKPVAEHGGLADVLKIRISLCDKDGNPLADYQTHEDFDKTVTGILTEGDLQLESQWQSPFENSNPEQRMPTLMGMLQSGDAQAGITSIASMINGVNTGIDYADQFKNSMANKLKETGEDLQSLEGRSNFTKLNSTMIYVSSSPVRISGTIFFSAWRDAKTEVNQQIALLKKWALPVSLYNRSLVESIAGEAAQGNMGGLFPSKIPPYVSVEYGGETYTPMIIENITQPLVVPMTAKGGKLAVAVNITFASRQAWDGEDMYNTTFSTSG